MHMRWRWRLTSYSILRHWYHILSNSHGAFKVQSNDYCFESGNTGRRIFKNSSMFTDGLEEGRHIVPTLVRKGRWRSVLEARRWIAIRLWRCLWLRLRKSLTRKRR